MIRLQRDRTAVPAGFQGQARVDRELELLEGKRDGHLTFKPSVWKAAKDQLKLESGGKCAYCEAPVSTVAHGDVEHFRPKSVYWWLAYCYDNYLFSCQICNQTYKGDTFVIRGQRLSEPVVGPGDSDAALAAMAGALAPDPLAPDAVFQAAAAAEAPAFLDPYNEDPEPFFEWAPDATLKEIEMRVAGASPDDRRSKGTRDGLGLNREELRRSRWATYSKLELFKDALPAVPPPLQERVRQEIQAMLAGGAEYAGMARYFVRAVWRLPL